MMRDAILGFNQQLSWQPEIMNAGDLKSRHKFIVLGMGGSHLAADLLLNWESTLNIAIHSNYDLPPALKGDELIIVSSYSGNTEEVIDGLHEAIKQQLDIAVMATGGKLIEIAHQEQLPYIQLPLIGIQPRSALGYSTAALLKLMGLDAGFNELTSLADKIKPAELEPEGQRIAKLLKGYVPVIYTSDRNRAIAYNWKIKFNETGKIPAFYNVLPELNHNEMTGFDVKDSSKFLSAVFHFIIIKDAADNPRILKRMEVLEKQYRSRGLPVEVLELSGQNQLEKIFTSLLIADWVALYTAEMYGLESEQVPMVEEFKKLIAR